MTNIATLGEIWCKPVARMLAARLTGAYRRLCGTFSRVMHHSWLVHGEGSRNFFTIPNKGSPSFTVWLAHGKGSRKFFLSSYKLDHFFVVSLATQITSMPKKEVQKLSKRYVSTIPPKSSPKDQFGLLFGGIVETHLFHIWTTFELPF